MASQEDAKLGSPQVDMGIHWASAESPRGSCVPEQEIGQGWVDIKKTESRENALPREERRGAGRKLNSIPALLTGAVIGSKFVYLCIPY